MIRLLLSSVILGGAGWLVLRRRRSSRWVSWSWLNDQERRQLNKSQEFEAVTPDWERHRWN